MSRKIHYAWIILIGTWLAFLGVGLIRFIYPYVVPTMESTLNLSHTVMATVISCFFWADTIMRIVWGTLSDRIGTRKTTMAGLLLLSIGFFIMSLGNTVPILGIGFAVCGMGAASLFILPSPILSRWFGQTKRSTAIGIATTASLIVMIVGGFIVPSILVKNSYNIIWRTEAFITLAILVIISLILYDSPADKRLTPYGASQEELDAIKQGPKEKGSIWGKQSIMRVLGNWSFYQIAGAYFLYGVAYTGVLTFLSSYLQQIGWQAAEAGRFISIMGIAGLIAVVVWGAVGDHMAKRFVFAIGLLSLSIGIVLIAFAGKIMAAAVLGVILFGGGGSAPVVMISAIQADYFPKNSIGTSFGICAACFSLASAISPIVGGTLADATGTLLSSLIMGICAGFLGAIVIASLKEPRKVKSDQTQNI